MTPRERAYALLAALGVIIPMYYNLQYMAAGGSILFDFFTVPLRSAITASVLFDLLVAFATFNVLLFAEGRTLGRRNFIACLLVSWLVAFAAGLPLLLFLRERQNRQEARDRLRAMHDYQVNLKAKLEIRQLHQKIDHLLSHQWERLVEIQEVRMELINEVRRRH